MQVRKRFLWLLIVVIILSAILFLRKGNYFNRQNDSFNRSQNLIYTKHARCRMECRQIDESEVREILSNGTINYSKSDLSDQPDPKYAIEGTTHDDQHVRIVVAPTDRGLVLITCIDLDREWNCQCN